jgi:hypothetical protein
MAQDQITLGLDGDVFLPEFVTAMESFYYLVETLVMEVAQNEFIEWRVTHLERGGTALATVQGVGNPVPVERVVHAYEAVGEALESGSSLPFPGKVEAQARRLTGFINGRIHAVRFETADKDAIVERSFVGQLNDPAPVIKAGPPLISYGAVMGRVQTLSSRGQLRFTLYDLLDDRAISCYLAEGQEDLMRDAWGKVAVVEGRLRRDRTTGRPVTLRQVTDVRVLDRAPDAWKQARGAVPVAPGGPSAEEVIRQLRDA